MKNFLKKIAITFLSAITTVMLVYGGYTIYAKQFGFQTSNLPYFAVFAGYHKEMNNFFNQKLEKLNKLMNSEDFYNDPGKKKLLVPPQKFDLLNSTLSEALEACGEENVSSYCISMGALEIYSAYVEKLNDLKSTLETNDSAYLEYIVERTRARNENIDKEIIAAKKIMEGAVAAYNEYHLAYPMHKKYKEIITDLVKYKLTLKDIRKRAAQFPIKFIDASSDQCS